MMAISLHTHLAGKRSASRDRWGQCVDKSTAGLEAAACSTTQASTCCSWKGTRHCKPVTVQDLAYKDIIEPLESVSVSLTPTDKKNIAEYGDVAEVQPPPSLLNHVLMRLLKALQLTSAPTGGVHPGQQCAHAPQAVGQDPGPQRGTVQAVTNSQPLSSNCIAEEAAQRVSANQPASFPQHL